MFASGGRTIAVLLPAEDPGPTECDLLCVAASCNASPARCVLLRLDTGRDVADTGFGADDSADGSVLDGTGSIEESLLGPRLTWTMSSMYGDGAR